MKLTITREDLRQFVLKEANIDISQAPIDIDIEGYKQITGRYKWQETTDDSVAKEIIAKVAGGSVNDSTSDLVKKLIWRDEDRKIITDNEGRVLDIVKEEKEPEKPKTKDMSANLKNHPDYTDYENTVLDFATSPEHKRQVPFFGAETIECCKARYQKMITKLNVKDSVKFSRIDSLPYLVKREGQESMNDVLNEGVNK
jgi:predicted CopG family antitoxin